MNEEPEKAEDTEPMVDGAPSTGAARLTPWILLRGLLRDRRHWGSLPGRLASWAPGQVAEAIDLSGNGSRYRDASASSIPAMVEELRDGLRRRGITSPVRVLAMSLGTLVAIEWARRYPEEVEHLVLINPAVSPMSPWTQRLFPALWWPLLRLLLLPAGAHAWEQTLLRHSSQRYRREDSQARHAVLDRWVAWHTTQPVSRLNIFRQVWAAVRYKAPTPPRVPGLLLVSRRDRMVDPQCSRRLAEAWGWQLLEHPKAGHDLALDDPRWLLRLLHERFAPAPGTTVAPPPDDFFEIEEVEDPRPRPRLSRPAALDDVTDIDLDGSDFDGSDRAGALVVLAEAPVTDWGPSLTEATWGTSDWGGLGLPPAPPPPPPPRFNLGIVLAPTPGSRPVDAEPEPSTTPGDAGPPRDTERN